MVKTMKRNQFRVVKAKIDLGFPLKSFMSLFENSRHFFFLFFNITKFSISSFQPLFNRTDDFSCGDLFSHFVNSVAVICCNECVISYYQLLCLFFVLSCPCGSTYLLDRKRYC
ncbi:hypothetical protein QVD17_15483 [Tagetes erecta]|uniref:Uncharacterized protein n=1 Tax=Tagetes erecta TaxID=13708 RepID=A0AAD8KSF5_TARER|nr:hypothetical protein QVD17_15483 [Tagetes erecta]